MQLSRRWLYSQLRKCPGILWNIIVNIIRTLRSLHLLPDVLRHKQMLQSDWCHMYRGSCTILVCMSHLTPSLHRGYGYARLVLVLQVVVDSGIMLAHIGEGKFLICNTIVRVCAYVCVYGKARQCKTQVTNNSATREEMIAMVWSTTSSLWMTFLQWSMVCVFVCVY